VQAQPTKVSRIGLLGIGSAEQSPFFEAFRQGLRERGWVDGQNILFEDWSAMEGYTQLTEGASQLARLKVDIVVSTGTTAALAARKAMPTTPIVTMMGADPVQTGLVASLGRPGGNVTGLANLGRELMGKRLELLKETLPSVSRVALLWDSDSRTEVFSLKDAEGAARSLSLHLQPVDVHRPEDLERAFANMMRSHPDALVPVTSNIFRAHRARVVALTAKNRLPGIFDTRVYVEAGGLMSYGSDTKAIFRGLAGYVDRILRGAKPGDLPVEEPTKLELVINLKTAKALGLTIPPDVLARADETIQ
jgi:putative tryptophan/tyrosine transport system substrate-binding protein